MWGSRASLASGVRMQSSAARSNWTPFRRRPEPGPPPNEGFFGRIHKFPVVISRRSHPIPSRTRKLSSLEPMVLLGRPSGRVGRRRDLFPKGPHGHPCGPLLFCPSRVVALGAWRCVSIRWRRAGEDARAPRASLAFTRPSRDAAGEDARAPSQSLTFARPSRDARARTPALLELRSPSSDARARTPALLATRARAVQGFAHLATSCRRRWSWGGPSRAPLV
jgi:hypothetical protein